MVEGELTTQKLSGLLIVSDFTGCHSIRGFFTPPVEGTLLLAAFVANCFLGALSLEDLWAVCLV